ncbi:MAG: MFS transporter, partial [Aliarcobacter sp.]
FIAPIILGIIFTFLNYEAIFFIYLTIGFFLGLYSLSRKRVADDDMSVFVNFPVTSGPVAAELDPRHD